MQVCLIAAIAQNGTIGRDNDLPWSIKEDMRFFVRTTRGHTVVSGRKNFQAMGRPLPKRRNIVITTNPSLKFEGAETVGDLPSALRLAQQAGEDQAFVIGGAQIYALALPYAHVFYRTTVLSDVPGDVEFPTADWSDWEVEELMSHPADDENEYAFVTEKLTRRASPREFMQK